MGGVGSERVQPIRPFLSWVEDVADDMLQPGSEEASGLETEIDVEEAQVQGQGTWQSRR